MLGAGATDDKEIYVLMKGQVRRQLDDDDDDHDDDHDEDGTARSLGRSS
jgi:hypothetical protein